MIDCDDLSGFLRKLQEEFDGINWFGTFTSLNLVMNAGEKEADT